MTSTVDSSEPSEAALEKLIRNKWVKEPGVPYAKAEILNHELHPEGLDVSRIRFLRPGSYVPDNRAGHIVSVLHGSGAASIGGSGDKSLRLEHGVHLFLPPGIACDLHSGSECELLVVSSPGAAQVRGKRLLVRDEKFLAACSLASQSLRWILTPQYLSRRIFLHHDETLLSKTGNPVSWFRTTMFDVAGLPANEDGESVFKMSYNSRTEFNVCYDVHGSAHVRMARHPYRSSQQEWGPWFPLDSEATYHLNEVSGTPRNKHEVRIVDGHVTLFCLFDPAPVGIERHRPGDYSDYEPPSSVLGTPAYRQYMGGIARHDEALDRLSLAKAQGSLDALEKTAVWEVYRAGRDAQKSLERQLADSLNSDGQGRREILSRWMQA